MAKRKDDYIKLTPIPGGRFDQYFRTIDDIPKDSNEFLYKMTDIYGSDEIVNMSEVNLADYAYGKGVIYMLATSVGRSVPRLEDGLKLVERRAIYTMWRRGYYGKKSTKVDTAVGDMIALCYPHGDQSSSTLFRIGRHWDMMLPYIQELSNYGNMQDKVPAAPRYADCSLTQYTMDCYFSEIGPRRPLWDEIDTYNFQDKEPVYLISKYPNSLMQWNQGITKGNGSYLCAFNSIDVFKTALLLMDNPRAKVEIYPDAPVPVEIVNKSKLRYCFDKSEFKVKMRAPYYFETDKVKVGNRVEDKYTIVFTALPLGTTGDMIKNEIKAAKTGESKKPNKVALPEIINVQAIVYDDTPGGVKVIVEYERGYDPNAIVEKLYRISSLAKTIKVKYNLTVNNGTKFMTPREVLLYWINQRYDQKRRYYHQMVLKAARDRAIYEGLGVILASADTIDKFIKLIRTSNDQAESIAKIRKEFGLSEFQARYLIEIKVKTLQKLDVKEQFAKRDQAIKDYMHYRKLLSSNEAIKESVRVDLEEGLRKYGKPRIAKLKNLKGSTVGDPGETKYVVYGNGYYYAFKDPSSLKTIASTVDSSYKIIKMANDDTVLVFTRNGIVRALNGYAFTLNDNGISIVDDVVSIIPYSKDDEKSSLVMITKDGYGKIMEIAELRGVNKCRSITLNSGDVLAGVSMIPKDYNSESIIGMIDNNTMYYLKAGDFPKYKRSSAGNKVLKNIPNLAITDISYLETTDDSDYIMLYGESGYLKIVDTKYLSFSRKGINTISMGGKKILGAAILHGTEDYTTLFMGVEPYVSEVKIQVGISTVFTVTETGQEHRIKMSTTIGSPVRVLKVNKTDWYAFR